MSLTVSLTLLYPSFKENNYEIIFVSFWWSFHISVGHGRNVSILHNDSSNAMIKAIHRGNSLFWSADSEEESIMAERHSSEQRAQCSDLEAENSTLEMQVWSKESKWKFPDSSNTQSPGDICLPVRLQFLTHYPQRAMPTGTNSSYTWAYLEVLYSNHHTNKV